MKGKAKKILLAVLVLAVLSVLGGCPIFMGEDGAAYMAIDWNSSWTLYANFTNSDLPSSVTRNVNYEHEAGTYSFTYYIYDPYDYSTPYSSTWLVTYTITINEGEVLADGDDKYFKIYCGWSGIVRTGFNIQGKAAIDADGGMINEQTIGNKTMRVEYRKVDAPRSDMVPQLSQ